MDKHKCSLDLFLKMGSCKRSYSRQISAEVFLEPCQISMKNRFENSSLLKAVTHFCKRSRVPSDRVLNTSLSILWWWWVNCCNIYISIDVSTAVLYLCLFKCALEDLRQLLINESSLKMMKNAFYFTLQALFVLKIFYDFLVM